MDAVPAYVQLKGSDQHPAPHAKPLGPADPNERFSVTIVLRRRPDGPPMPDLDYYARTPPSHRRRLPKAEFASKYGASPADITAVSAFVTGAGLTVVETSAVRRSVIVSGTVAQMNRAFGVSLEDYEVTCAPPRAVTPSTRHVTQITEVYRGRDGFIFVPEQIADAVMGVFGLDNRNITQQNGSGDPPSTSGLTVPEVVSFYNFPTNSAAGGTIAIVALGSYVTGNGTHYSSGFDTRTGPTSDLGQYFNSIGQPIPTVITVPSAAISFNGTPDSETTQDICIAATVARHATIAVYFLSHFSDGKFPGESAWVNLIGRIVHPEAGDFPAGVQPPSVISCSNYICDGDDSSTRSIFGVKDQFIDAFSAALQDAAQQQITVCIASGDQGSDSKLGSAIGVKEWGFPFPNDNKAHVQYPASDPWVLSCGGTTIGKDTSTGSFVEYVWNDIFPTYVFPGGQLGGGFATGGGVSDYFTLDNQKMPPWQRSIPVASVNDGHFGRGVPDVAGNASANSGYKCFVNGFPSIMWGTSAVAPLYAGLIAVINAALHGSVGFLNPTLYALGNSVFRHIGAVGPQNNGLNGIKGYSAGGQGWNACAGWGVIEGNKLLSKLRTQYQTVYAKNDGRALPLSGAGNINQASGLAEILYVTLDLPGDYLIMAKAELWNQDSMQQTGVVGVWAQAASEVGGPPSPETVKWIAMASVGLDGNNGDGPLTQRSVSLIGKHTSVLPDDIVILGAATFLGQALRYSLWAMPVGSLVGVDVNETASTLPGNTPIGYKGLESNIPG